MKISHFKLNLLLLYQSWTLFNAQAVGGDLTAKKFQKVANVNFRALALILIFTFDKNLK